MGVLGVALGWPYREKQLGVWFKVIGSGVVQVNPVAVCMVNLGSTRIREVKLFEFEVRKFS